MDGRLVPNNPELVQIAENMPMVHLSVKNHEFVRTSVGACWHGRSAQFAQHFVVSLLFVIIIVFQNPLVYFHCLMQSVDDQQPRNRHNQTSTQVPTNRIIVVRKKSLLCRT